MPRLENAGPENVGLKNTAPENARLENERPYCTRWKMKDQEKATLYQLHGLNTAACFSEYKQLFMQKTTQCNKV